MKYTKVAVLLLISMGMVGCVSTKYRVKQVFHDHDADYRTQAKVVSGLKVPKDMKFVSMKPHYVIPKVPDTSKKGPVSLWPPGISVKH